MHDAGCLGLVHWDDPELVWTIPEMVWGLESDDQLPLAMCMET